MDTILIVEDDVNISTGLEMNLKREGYKVLKAFDGETGLQLSLDEAPDLVILDWMLPGVLSGFEVCRRLRRMEAHMPILMLTCKSSEDDKVAGLEVGADDYMTKPFSVAELLARVNAILRRQKRLEATSENYQFGPYELDLEGQVLIRDGAEEVELSRKEFLLMKYFCQNEGKVLDRRQILGAVWGHDYEGTDRTVDNYVNKLRAKIEGNPAKPQYILTARGSGYKFVSGARQGARDRS